MRRIHPGKKKYKVILEVDENVYGQGRHGVIATSHKYDLAVKGSSKGDVKRKIAAVIQSHLGI